MAPTSLSSFPFVAECHYEDEVETLAQEQSVIIIIIIVSFTSMDFIHPLTLSQSVEDCGQGILFWISLSVYINAD